MYPRGAAQALPWASISTINTNLKNNFMGDYYLLDSVRFSPQERTLINDDSAQSVVLTNISARCLLCFCQRYGELISHDELIEFVWDIQHKTVQYNSLYQTLLILRRSLAQVGLSQELIRTLPRKGFIMSGVTLTRRSADDAPTTQALGHAVAPGDDSVRATAPGLARRIPIAVWLVIVSLTLLVIGALWHESVSTRRNFFSGYEVVKDAPGAGVCTWLYNSDASNFQRHWQFSADHPELCNAREAIYVTAYESSRKISAIACSNSLTRGSRQALCTSWYYPNRPTVNDSP